MAALALGYLLLYGCAFYSAAPPDQGGLAASLWRPPAGLTVFGILAFGWLGVALGASGSALTLLLAAVGRESSLSVSEFSIGILLHTMPYALAVLPLRRFVGHSGFLIQPAQAGWFLITATLGAVLATGGDLIRLGWLSQIDSSQLGPLALVWLLGAFIGIVTTTPLLLVLALPGLDHYLRHGDWRWSQGRAATDPMRMSRWMLGEGLVLALALPGVFGLPWSLGLSQGFSFAALFLLPPLVWVTLRGGLRGAVLGTAVLNSGLALLVARFGHSDHALAYQLVMIAIALTGLFLGSVVEARNQAQAALQTYVGRLEQEVATKTRDLQSANQELALKESYLRTLVSAAPVGIAQFDAQGHCSYLNSVGCVLTACSEETARGRPFLDFIHPDDREYVEFVWQLHCADQSASWLDFRLQDSNFWVSAQWIHLPETTGQPLSGSIVIFSDMTEKRRRDHQTWTLAHYDALTSLPNRNLFWERLDQALRRAKRDFQNTALLWIDLDGFKAVNDRLGHAAGDELLQQVAVRLNSRMRDSDTVARMGGDEFTVILPDIAHIATAEQVAADLVARLVEPFWLQSGTGHISASIGVALFPQHAEDAKTLVRCADMAMYVAKNAGKNRVQIWQPHF